MVKDPCPVVTSPCVSVQEKPVLTDCLMGHLAVNWMKELVTEVVVSAFHYLKKKALTVGGLAKSPCQVPYQSQANWMVLEEEKDNPSMWVDREQHRSCQG